MNNSDHQQISDESFRVWRMASPAGGYSRNRLPDRCVWENEALPTTSFTPHLAGILKRPPPLPSSLHHHQITFLKLTQAQALSSIPLKSSPSCPFLSWRVLNMLIFPLWLIIAHIARISRHGILCELRCRLGSFLLDRGIHHTGRHTQPCPKNIKQ